VSVISGGGNLNCGNTKSEKRKNNDVNLTNSIKDQFS
jgi:hypothetical protein